MVNVKKDIKNILKYLLLEKLTDKDYSFNVEDGDNFLISYPKSGNTWMRFLLANLIRNEDVSLVNIDDIIFSVYSMKNKSTNKLGKRIIKSHSYFDIKFSSNKVVYIVRDVRDVVVSLYYYYKKKCKIEIEFNDFFCRFINDEVYPEFGNWGHHLGSWIGAKGGDKVNFLLIRYEDMLEDTFKELKKVCEFLNIDANEDRIKRAVENCNFNKLKLNEEEVENIATETKDSRKDIKFFRKGTSGQWKDILTEDQLQQLYNKFGYQMKLFQYIKE